MNIGETIKNARKQKGFSQEEFAGMLFVDRSLISKWENNKIQPGTEQMKRIGELLEIDIPGNSDNSVLSPVMDYGKITVFLLINIIAIVLKPWGIILALGCLVYSYKEKLPVRIKVLGILICLYLVYQMLWFYGYQFIYSDIRIE